MIINTIMFIQIEYMRTFAIIYTTTTPLRLKYLKWIKLINSYLVAYNPLDPMEPADK